MRHEWKNSFVETVKHQAQAVRVDYMGKVAGAEIKFTRPVDRTIKEELVTKRLKESNPE